MSSKGSNSSGIVTNPIQISKSTEFPSKPHAKPSLILFLQSVQDEDVDEEIREAIIGMTVAWKLLYVVYTIPNEDKFRIISARPVTKSERN